MSLTDVRCTECSARFDSDRLLGTCRECGAPLSAHYEAGALLERVRKPGALPISSMWDYAPVLPVSPGRPPVTLGEGATPLVELPALARRFGLRSLLVKDESREPTGSFKARGMSAAVTAARDRGARLLCAPSAGNAAGALAAYAARAGLRATLYVPARAPAANRLEARCFGADTVEGEGSIAEAAKRMRREVPAEAFDLSTTREPFRVDGKKTMGWELFEQTEGALADWLLYPTGGGTGLLGVEKALDEIESLLGRPVRRPRFVAVQTESACPVVRALASGAREVSAHHSGPTLASGLEVPLPFAGRWLLRTLRRHDGAGVAVGDAEILQVVRDTARSDGFLLCPEAAATIAALPRLRDEDLVRPGERVVTFQTASPYKYAHVLEAAAGG